MEIHGDITDLLRNQADSESEIEVSPSASDQWRDRVDHAAKQVKPAKMAERQLRQEVAELKKVCRRRPGK